MSFFNLMPVLHSSNGPLYMQFGRLLRDAIRDGCKPVPGAEAVYFGADQPRITAELLIPWSVLGSKTPHAGASLHLEAAMTSWHRERWMSLSGHPPDQGMADPAGWRAIRLGDGMTVRKSGPDRRG